MAIEGISSVSAGYSVQGSKGTSAAPAAPKAEPVAKVESTPVVAETLSVTEDTGRKEKENDFEAHQPTSESLQKAVETINKKLGDSKVVFGFHEATNRLTVKMVDKETDKVLKEFPAEETLDMLARIWEMAGIMVDERR